MEGWLTRWQAGQRIYRYGMPTTENQSKRAGPQMSGAHIQSLEITVKRPIGADDNLAAVAGDRFGASAVEQARPSERVSGFQGEMPRGDSSQTDCSVSGMSVDVTDPVLYAQPRSRGRAERT